MRQNVLVGVSFLLTMFFSASCEDMDDFEDYLDDESLEERASSIIATHQAENRTGASGCKVANNHAGFTGSGFIDYGGNGTWIEWNNINVSSAGNYTLIFRYAADSNTDRRAAIIVNGGIKGNVAFSDTGSWTRWRTDSITVSLRQGNNRVRVMANTSSGGPNLDSVQVSGSGNNDGGGDEDPPDKCEDAECSSDCPCGEGKGDCDRDSDCKSGLECKQQSGTDYCVKPDDDDGGGGGDDSSGVSSNLQVRIDGKWRGVCCVGGDLEISSSNCKWTESGRVLKTRDTRSGNSTALDCPEGGAKDCTCSSSGERMHGIKANGNVQVKNSLILPNGAPIYPNSGHEYCVDLVSGELRSRTTSSSCPDWRLVNFY